MDLQDVLHNAVAAQRQASLKNSPQLSLGELILKLEAIPDKTVSVYFDFGDTIPTTLDSWRGAYDELALGYAEKGIPPTVEALLTELKGAVGKTYEGYKGGDFTMGRTTPVWVSNYGTSSNTAIIDVLDKEYMVILQTAYCEF